MFCIVPIPIWIVIHKKYIEFGCYINQYYYSVQKKRE